MEECAYNTPKLASKVLVCSLLADTNLNYIALKWCIYRASADRQKKLEFSDKAELTRQKELVDRAGLNHLRWETDNGACLTATPRHLDGMDLSRD